MYLGPAIRKDLRITGPVPLIVWIWLFGMLVMLIALWAGHVNWKMGLASTIKSTIGWMKGWALLFLFPFIGASLPIRVAPLARAQATLGMWVLILLPIFLIAPHIGLPQQVFVSPLKAVGGPGPEYFTVYLYTIDPGTWVPRFQFYAPWSPFAGLLGVVMVLFSLEDTDSKWVILGVLGGVAMIYFSKSRMSLVALPVCIAFPRMLPLIGQKWGWYLGGICAASMAVLFDILTRALNDFISAFKGARADSSRVRDALQRIAYDRWQNEAMWFGHGRVERGPHLVEYMPIGSHHTWYGLLFVKGLVGFLALAVPFIAQFGIVLYDTVRHPRGRLPLGIMLVFLILSMGENMEIEVYLLWPGLVVLGIHARQMADAAKAKRLANDLP
jgi:hypothetical protein